MKVNSREAAWREVDRLFPTDYIQDEEASENAGYPIYVSTSSNQDMQLARIADLGCRLEVNDGIDTINIWIAEDKSIISSELYTGMEELITKMIDMQKGKMEGMLEILDGIDDATGREEHLMSTVVHEIKEARAEIKAYTILLERFYEELTA